MLTPEQRSLKARAAAHALWGKVPDRDAKCAHMRHGFEARIVREVDREHPNLTPEARAKMIESRRKAYYTHLAYLSSKARRERKEARKRGDGA